MLEILPGATVHTVDFLGGEEELLHHIMLGVKFHKLAAIEGVEAAEVGAHPVGRERPMLKVARNLYASAL